MKMRGKIVLESMEGSCVRIGPGVDSAYTHVLKQCSKHCHTRLHRSSHSQRLHRGLPILAILFSVIVMSYECRLSHST